MFHYTIHHHQWVSEHQHRHTHTQPCNGPLSGTSWVSRYQKGKTSLDFTEARNYEWQWHQLGRMHVYTSLQTDKHPTTQFFTGQMLFVLPNQQRRSTDIQLTITMYDTMVQWVLYQTGNQEVVGSTVVETWLHFWLKLCASCSQLFVLVINQYNLVTINRQWRSAARKLCLLDLLPIICDFSTTQMQRLKTMPRT